MQFLPREASLGQDEETKDITNNSMKTSIKTLNTKIDQSRRRQARSKPLKQQEAHNSPAKTSENKR